MKNITNKSRELTSPELYMLTMSPRSHSMKNHVGERIEVDAWAVFEDTDKKSGEVRTVLSVLSRENMVYTTISPTFQSDFLDMAEIFHDDFSIEVVSGKSKAGRDFVTCALAI